MRIRKSTELDFERMMEIYAYARRFMAEHGNPNQWGPTNWPPEALIHSDIQEGNSYVCLDDDGQVIGTFFFVQGQNIEPTYKNITDGAWIDNSAYGVVHRIAGDGSRKGIGEFCLNWALEQCGHLRIDTHGDNVVMQGLLKKLGFTHCGTIYVHEDNDPRLAFEKTSREIPKGQKTGFKVKYFDELTTRELYEILRTRSEIFVVEQNCPYQDLDGTDYTSLHVFSEEGGLVTSYLRVFYRDAETVQIGRVVTLKHGTGLGGKLLREGIEQAKAKFHPKWIYLEAQCYAAGFYAREGFKVCSDEFMLDNIPHCEMMLDLEG